MRFIAILATVAAALFTASAVVLDSGSVALQTTAGGICPATMVWDGQHCV